VKCVEYKFFQGNLVRCTVKKKVTENMGAVSRYLNRECAMKNENGLELAVEGGSNILSLAAMPLGGGKSISRTKICRSHCRPSLLATIMMLREGQWPIGKRALLLFVPKTYSVHSPYILHIQPILCKTCIRHSMKSLH